MAANPWLHKIQGRLDGFLCKAIRERTKAGLLAARQRGRVGGRPRLFTAEEKRAALRLLANGTPPRDVANVLGISIPTLYRHLPASQRTALAEAA